jgi:hypothetical protein
MNADFGTATKEIRMSDDPVDRTPAGESRISNSNSGREPSILPSIPETARPETKLDQHNDVSRYVTLKRDCIDFLNAVVLSLAFVAAGYAGFQGNRLANLTQVSINDARTTADAQHRDTLEALQRAKDANALARDTADRQARETASALALSKATSDAAQASAKETIYGRRPSVGIDNTEVIINKPLTFDKSGASINFDVWFKNTGNSVAINTSSARRSLFIQPLTTFPIPVNGPSENLASIINCNADIANVFTQMGTIIFPGGRFKVSFDEQVPIKQSRPDQKGLVSAWFPICIVYRDDEGGTHGTGFILIFESKSDEELFPPSGQVKGEIKVFSAGKNIF